MDRKRFKRSLYVFIVLLSGCVSSGPPDTYLAEKPPAESAGPGASLPEWTVSSLRQLTARVEFSVGDGEDMTECGIVFFNAIKDPRTVTAALLVANDEIYPLEEITVLFANNETHELRINTLIPRPSLAAALRADTLYLVAALDGVEYQFEPGEDFAAYKKRALEKIN
jgi:hypothetical protein